MAALLARNPPWESGRARNPNSSPAGGVEEEKGPSRTRRSQTVICFSLPIRPLRTNSQARRNFSLLRCCVPVWKTILCLWHRFHHVLAFVDGQGEWLFPVNILARLGRSQIDQRVPVVRRGHDDDRDVVALQEFRKSLYLSGRCPLGIFLGCGMPHGCHRCRTPPQYRRNVQRLGIAASLPPQPMSAMAGRSFGLSGRLRGALPPARTVPQTRSAARRQPPRASNVWGKCAVKRERQVFSSRH